MAERHFDFIFMPITGNARFEVNHAQAKENVQPATKRTARRVGNGIKLRKLECGIYSATQGSVMFSRNKFRTPPLT